MARSGVYRSTYDLVADARNHGLDWSGVIGIRDSAQGTMPTESDHVDEFGVKLHGRAVLRELHDNFWASAKIREADFVISLITQSDLVLSGLQRELRGRWVAYVRGLPWPDRGEQTAIRRTVLRFAETRALRKATEVWATTPILANQIAKARKSIVMPAGVPYAPRIATGHDGTSPLVWVGRVDQDKRPEAFIEIVSKLAVPGRIVGSGPLAHSLQAKNHDRIEWAGWLEPNQLWGNASVFVGTAAREAFGRSAVEAAQAGLPMVLSDQYGAAPFLFTDPDLIQRFVLPIEPIDAWINAIQELLGDEVLRRSVSDHVSDNAQTLTIADSVSGIQNRLEQITSNLGGESNHRNR